VEGGKEREGEGEGSRRGRVREGRGEGRQGEERDWCPQDLFARRPWSYAHITVGYYYNHEISLLYFIVIGNIVKIACRTGYETAVWIYCHRNVAFKIS